MDPGVRQDDAIKMDRGVRQDDAIIESVGRAQMLIEEEKPLQGTAFLPSLQQIQRF
jgi:hypothetical protein